MGKHSRKKGGSILPMLLIGGAAVAAGITLSEKANALQRVSENWEVTGFKLLRFDGLTNAVAEVELTFFNTNRQAAVLDSLAMNVKYKSGILATVRLPHKTTIAPQGPTPVRAEVVIRLDKLLTSAISWTETVKVLAQLKGKSLADQLKLVQQKAGLKDVQFDGDIVIAGVQRHFSFTTDLGNVTRPVKPTLGPVTDAPKGGPTSTTA